MTHLLKLQKEFCDAVFIGEKEFEVRYNDRGFQRGDIVRFVPMDGKEEFEHPLIEEQYVITYVLSGWGIRPGYVVFGIRNVAASPGRRQTPKEIAAEFHDALDEALGREADDERKR